MKLLKKIFNHIVLNFCSSRTDHSDETLLMQVKSRRSWLNYIKVFLSLTLLFLIGAAYFLALPQLTHANPLKNDLNKQVQVFKMEMPNQSTLKCLVDNREEILNNTQMIYSNMPKINEKAEAMISILKDVTTTIPR